MNAILNRQLCALQVGGWFAISTPIAARRTLKRRAALGSAMSRFISFNHTPLFTLRLLPRPSTNTRLGVVGMLFLQRSLELSGAFSICALGSLGRRAFKPPGAVRALVTLLGACRGIAEPASLNLLVLEHFVHAPVCP